MVGHAALREIVGADALAAVARCPPGSCRSAVNCAVLFLLLLRPAGGLRRIFRALSLFLNWLRSSWHSTTMPVGMMGDPDGGGRLVDVLAARAGGTERVDLQIVRVERKLHFFGLGQHRHGDGGGVDAALGLGLRHALHPVHAAFELQAGVGARPLPPKS